MLHWTYRWTSWPGTGTGTVQYSTDFGVLVSIMKEEIFVYTYLLLLPLGYHAAFRGLVKKKVDPSELSLIAIS